MRISSYLEGYRGRPSGLVDNALAFETMGTGFEPRSGLVDNALAFETMGTGSSLGGGSGLVDNALAFETIGTGFEPQWGHHHSLRNAGTSR
ncbi:unnamed protein product [Trichobilharzia regenti]|nr:unnamed protein product [Trichobilharzia regenti]